MLGEALVLEAIGRGNAALVVLDRAGRVNHWSEGAARLWGWGAADCVGRQWADLGLSADTAGDAQARIVAAAVAEGRSCDVEWTAHRADGSAVRLHTTTSAILHPEGAVLGAVLLSIDLSARESLERALVRAAMHDQLTGVPGRSLFVREVALALADRRGPHCAAVLFIDLDGFKRVNDEHGHAVGDEVLVAIADRLRAAVRDGDIVARLGGDEFAVLVRLGGSSQVAVDLAERISRSLAEPVLVTAGLVEVGASVGVALAGLEDDPDDVLRRADAAMYRAKRSVPRAWPAAGVGT